MCLGVMFVESERIKKTYFQNSMALLPLRLKSGDQKLVIWGRRQQEQGYSPVGAWAKFSSIESGYWDEYFPKSVKIDVQEFMQNDQATGVGEWYSLNQGEFIHGLLILDADRLRVYVVTVDDHHRMKNVQTWPRIIRDRNVL